VDAAAQLSKPLIGGPRSYYLALFNDDTVYFERTNYPELGEAERVQQEQQSMRAAAIMDEEMKEQRPVIGRGRKGTGALVASGQRAPMMLTQDSVLVEPEIIYPGDVVTIRRLLREGVGYQPGDMHLGQPCRVCAVPSRLRLVCAFLPSS